MRLTNFIRYYGLQRPFDFTVAIPFLLNILFLALIFITCVPLILTGNLRVGTERFYFLTYISTLLLLAALCSRSTRLSLAALAWCTIELGLALSSSTLESVLGGSLLPKNAFSENIFGSRFIYHPILQIALRPNAKETMHYDRRNYDPAVNAIVYPETYNREFTFSHNSLGIRGAELTEADLGKPMIFTYGGSTTYDWTVTQGDTWAERLQSQLNNKFTVVNFGVIGHSTTEHVTYTAFYQSILGKMPVCAIYYVGWNDISSSHVEHLDPAYANFHSLGLAPRKPGIWAAKYSPLLRLAEIRARDRFDSIPQAPNPYQKNAVVGTDSNLERFFVEHLSTIIAINKSRGIRSIFIGQILNKDLLIAPRAGRLFPLLSDRDVWPTQERYNSIMRSTAISLGANYIDAGVDNFANRDFADFGHFSASGSKKFAALVSEEVGNYCQ
jgi:hypothetical protein